MRVQVKDFMVTSVITALSDSKVYEIRRLMQDNDISAVPIVEITKELPQNKINIKGIVTASDLNRSLDVHTQVTELMSEIVHVVHKDSSAQSAAKMMIKHDVHHIVVMDEGKIVGILSSSDFVRLVANYQLVEQD